MQLVHEARPVIPRDRLLRLPQVQEVTGLKKSAIYELARTGRFPRRIRLSARATVWAESEVLQWVQDRISEGQQ